MPSYVPGTFPYGGMIFFFIKSDVSTSDVAGMMWEIFDLLLIEAREMFIEHRTFSKLLLEPACSEFCEILSQLI